MSSPDLEQPNASFSWGWCCHIIGEIRGRSHSRWVRGWSWRSMNTSLQAGLAQIGGGTRLLRGKGREAKFERELGLKL